MRVIKRLAVLCCLLPCLVFASPSSNTGSVFVYFSFPPISGFQTYTIYYGTSSGLYTGVVPTGTSTNWTVGSLARGTTYYFNVTQTADNVESDYTTEVPITIPAKPPKATSLSAVGQ